MGYLHSDWQLPAADAVWYGLCGFGERCTYSAKHEFESWIVGCVQWIHRMGWTDSGRDVPYARADVRFATDDW
ncbi:hypothetical protein D3C74_496330 [compost metagenome]